MPWDRAARTGAGLALGWLVVVVSLDIATPGTLVLTALFGLAPLIACTVLRGGTTVLYAAAALALAVSSGWWNHTLGTAQQLVRVIDVALVGAAAVAIAVVRVRRDTRHARVVKIAEVAQRAVLPRLPARVGQVSLGARYLSAAEDTVVGGDLYDAYFEGSQVRLLIGDVRGKGIGAVEQAARVIRSFRQAAARQTSLAAVAADMSRYLVPFFDDEEFVTALLVEACEPGRLRPVSCGHPPPQLVDADGDAQLLEAPAGLPLGLGDAYDDLTVRWSPGDRLLLYTDGLSEARDSHGEFLPLLPLAPLLGAATVDDALDGLLAAVAEHVPAGELSDDLAVVVVEHVSIATPSASIGVEVADDQFSAGR